MPTPFDPQLLLGQRFGLAYLLRLTNEAIQSAMLGTVGFVVLAMFLRRRWAAMLVAIALFTPVAVNGMFAAGTPLLDLLLGALIIVIFFLVVSRFGLLAATAALTTHFLLLRAPITTNLGVWWAQIGLAMLGLLIAATVAAASFALGKGVAGDVSTCKAECRMQNDNAERLRLSAFNLCLLEFLHFAFCIKLSCTPMPTCPTCTTELPDSADVCPRCATPLPWAAGVTRLSGPDGQCDRTGQRLPRCVRGTRSPRRRAAAG